MADISVVIGTFGDLEWSKLARQRAVPSVQRQIGRPLEWIHVHGPSLHEARNDAARSAQGDWLIFLDADDELDERYTAEMGAFADRCEGDWLLQPATLGVFEGREDPVPVVIPRMRLLDGNYMVIGTMVRRDQFLRLGGFGDWTYAEDWDLWIRCWLDGAQCAPVPNAIYRVHVNPQGRNSQERAEQIRVYNEIRATYQGRERREPSVQT